nr:hypothetical protein [Tanacetum cinerariifolium]
MSTPVSVDPKSSTQADGAQCSRVPVPLSKDPCEAIRQAYLVGTDTESKPFEGKARTPESPHIVAPPTCQVEESKGSGTSGVRSTSSDSTAPLSPDHPLTYTTPVLVPILRRTARMAVRVPPMMSSGLSAVRKRYRGTSELILGTDSKEDEEVEESSDFDSESEDVKDEGPTAEDEDPAEEDEGLAAGVEGPGLDDESYGLDDESHGVDSESYGLDDESRGIDDEGRGIESDGLGLGEEEVVPKGQQRAVLVVWKVMSEPLGLGYGALRRRELSLEEDHVYSTFEVGHGSGSAPEPERSERWMSGSLLISPSLSVVPLPVSSPMIPLTVPSPIATSTVTIPDDEDQFIEVGAQLELHRGILQDHTQRLDAMPPTLFAEIDMDVRELYTRSGARPVLALEAWAGCVDTRMTDMSWAGYDDNRLVHDMLLQQTALQRELQEMKDRMTVLEQERDRREQ